MSLTEKTTLQDLSSDERAELERIADLFFEGIDPVFRFSSHSSSLDRYHAMLLIHNYVFSHFADGSSPISILTKRAYCYDTAIVKPGKLEYCYDIYETSCYDGGCCGTCVDCSYLYLKIISDQELQEARENKAKDKENHGWRNTFGLIRQYQDRFPDDSSEEFSDSGHVYLSHPFHTTFNLCIYS